MANDLSTSSSVTTGELAALLHAMDEKYRALFEVIIKQGGTLKPEVEAKEDVHPLQMPLVKLEGDETYGSWAEHAETILVSRRLEGYVLGTIDKPADENSKEGQKWKTTNALVRAWLLSSISPHIAKQIERIKEASDIWRLLKGTFSGVGNEMLACRIQKKLQDLTQGEKPIVEYVSELKRLWSDLDYYDPVGLECSNCVEQFGKWIEKRRVRDFLNGLTSKFENRRAALYGSTKLPTLEQAISAIISEETRLRLEEGGPNAQGMVQKRAALFAAETTGHQRQGMPMDDRKCFECGQSGHLKASCPELIMGVVCGRGPDWRGRGRGRFGDGRFGGHGRSMRMAGRVNMSVAGGESSQMVKVEMTSEELEKWRRFKEASDAVKHQNEVAAASADFCGTWDWQKTWDRELA